MATSVTSTSRAKILPSEDLIEALIDETRDISLVVEFKWDDYTWTDESDYVISAQADEQMDDTLSEAIASTADIVLSNATERFLPENPDSLIKNFLVPHKEVRISVTAEGVTYRMFTGYIRSITPQRQTGTVNINCFDNADKILQYECPREAYSNQHAHDLISILALNAGLEETDLELDYSDHQVTAAWFEETETWEAMGKIAAAERGRVFFNRNGNLRFWNRDYIKNQEPVITLNGLDHIISMDSGVTDETIINYVTVTATPRAADGLQAVWDNGNILIQNQYEDPLVWIPAGNQQSAWIEIDDPATDWTQPVATTDYIANTAVDGSGTNITGSISILDWNTYGNAAYITVKNNSTSDAYFTHFQVRANPLLISKWIKVRQVDQTSIDRYGERKREIENNYIDDETMAANIVEAELDRWNDATTALDIQTIGLPFLHVGDVVRVETSKSATETVDQYQSVSESNQAFGSITTKALAQRFTPEFPYLSRVLIRAGKPGVGSFAGTVTISVQENESGIPSGIPIVQATIDPAQWGSLEDDIDYSVNLEWQPELNKIYYLVLSSSSSNGSNYTYIKKATSEDYYPRGDFLKSSNGTSWSEVGSTSDMFFQWYGYKGLVEKQMIKTINWSVNATGGFTQNMTLIAPVELPQSQTMTSKADIFYPGVTQTATSKGCIVPIGTETKFAHSKAKIVEW